MASEDDGAARGRLRVQANVVASDAYDRAAIVRLRRASHAWRALDADGAKLVPHFPALVEDLFCALFKLDVVLRDEAIVPASTAFSRRVLRGVLQGPAYELLRLHTPLDEARAGLGAVLIGEAVLRALREDRVLTSGDLLDLWNLEREEEAAHEAAEEADVGRELAEAAEESAAGHDADPPRGESEGDAPAADDTTVDAAGGEPADGDLGAGEARAPRTKRADARAMRAAADRARLTARGVAAQREQKRRRVAAAFTRVEKKLDRKLLGAAASAAGKVADLNESLEAWGRGLGAGGARDPGQSIDLGRRLADNEKMRRLFGVFGRIRDQALSVRRRVLDRTDEELHEIRPGRGLEDLGRLIPHELVALSHPVLRRDFQRRLLDGGVLTYALRGTDRRGHGPLVVCLDTSSSMAGEKELWSKAVALTFVELARRRRRRCHVVCFSSGARALRHFDMNPGNAWTVALDRTLDLADHFSGGGTDFRPPLDMAARLLGERAMRRGDLVLITDGECDVDPAWRDDFLDRKRRRGFAVYSILIDVRDAQADTVRVLSDRVSLVSDLRADSRHLFVDQRRRRVA